MVLVTTGICLTLLAKKKYLGASLLFTISASWLLFLAKYLYPALGKKDVIHASSRYNYLGESVSEITQNLWIKPLDLLSHTLPGDSLFYLLILFLPFIFLIVRSDKTILMGSFPLILSNLYTIMYLSFHFPILCFIFP